MNLEPHPLADIFPSLDVEALGRLVLDVRARGLLHAITLFEGQILDGRNRYHACVAAGVEPRFEVYEGDDPRGFVISSNLERRHLDESQRSMIAAKLETLQQGQHPKDANLHVLRHDAAKQLNVSVRSVASASAVRQRAVPELVAAVEGGTIPVSVAAKLCDLAPDQQRQAVAEPDKARHVYKREHRADREVELAGSILKASETLGSKVYGVIYADPPWQFRPYSSETGMDRAADNHYPTMTLDAIKALEIPAADDAALFLWATAPMLREALQVMEAWGFDYKSHFVWRKDRTGTGYWNRSRHELLLIGTRGNVPAPAPGEQFDSIIDAKVQQHSRKPQHFRDIIEETFPSIPRIELFARETIAGWDRWGAECPSP